MSNKEVYEEIYNSYLNSIRHKTDYAEMGQPDPYDSMEEKLKQLLPETWRELSDDMGELLHESHRFGFFCGLREAGRHLMLTEVQG